MDTPGFEHGADGVEFIMPLLFLIINNVSMFKNQVFSIASF